MKGDLQIHKLMTREPDAVKPADRMSSVQAVMRKHKIHHVPVVEDGRFVGLLSATDLVRIAFGDPYTTDPEIVDKDLELFTARDVMAEDVVTIRSDHTIREAAKLLAGGSYHALPVVDDGVLVGIVTSTDLILYLIDE